jgi:hypothetical protein
MKAGEIWKTKAEGKFTMITPEGFHEFGQVEITDIPGDSVTFIPSVSESPNVMEVTWNRAAFVANFEKDYNESR